MNPPVRISLDLWGAFIQGIESGREKMAGIIRKTIDAFVDII